MDPATEIQVNIVIETFAQFIPNHENLVSTLRLFFEVVKNAKTAEDVARTATHSLGMVNRTLARHGQTLGLLARDSWRVIHGTQRQGTQAHP